MNYKVSTLKKILSSTSLHSLVQYTFNLSVLWPTRLILYLGVTQSCNSLLWLLHLRLISLWLLHLTVRCYQHRVKHLIYKGVKLL